MQVITTCAEMSRLSWAAERPLGLVPTMGALHEGHLSLVRQARTDSAAMAASIFVNPTQFGPNEDFATYPRSLERDLELLQAEGADLVFVPPPHEVYPDGFDTWVEPGSIAEGMEGAARPGHFRGVATVVAKLFTIIRPDRAYFGQKDGQQVAVIRKMNADLNLGVDVVTMPTIREPDGLALSSRNAYLSAEERETAPAVYRALCAAEDIWRRGERDAGRIQRAAHNILSREPLIDAVDYVSTVDAETMQPLETVPDHRPVMIAIAVRLGPVRLIDNVVLG
ncbi:MAG: pantoate--beta-alanine ligase [Chloroflexota bacterium]|nr:pantoate--beta-alanine ligase [Chloroflexota bacterium]MDE2960782.1 pantoate--beta-alanine ligase [Chloroflexota bacterium]